MTRIDAIFHVERCVHGLDAAARLEARQRLVRPLVDELHDRMRTERDTMSRHNRVAKTIYDPLHYIPVLARKPGALRNGAPFKDWDLPPALRRVQRKLERQPGGDRQVVEILGAVLIDGLDAVEAACAEALSHCVHSAGVDLNILARHREPPPPLTIATPDASRQRRASRATVEPRACGQLRSLRQPEETNEWNDHRCWTHHAEGVPPARLAS